MHSLPSLRGLWFVALWCRRSPSSCTGKGKRKLEYHLGFSVQEAAGKHSLI